MTLEEIKRLNRQVIKYRANEFAEAAIGKVAVTIGPQMWLVWINNLIAGNRLPDIGRWEIWSVHWNAREYLGKLTLLEIVPETAVMEFFPER